MKSGTLEFKRETLERLKQRIRTLNWVVLLVVYVILLLIVKFLYNFLDFIPLKSVITVLSISAGLVIIGLYLANSTSKSAIKTIDDYSRKLGTLLGATRDIHGIVHSDTLLENVMDISLKVTGADAGSVLLAKDDSLVFSLVKGSERRGPDGVSMPIRDGVAGWVVENGRALRADDVKEDGRLRQEEAAVTGREARSVLCVPLRMSAGVVGALELIRDKPRPFSFEDEEILSYFADQAAISLERARFYEDQKNFEIHLTNILIDAMESSVHEKKGHARRTAKYALLMAGALNMSEEEKKRLYKAALLHDIGFLKINLDEVTSMRQYRQHSGIGYEMLKPINFYADIAPIIRHHHERHDGSGYPDGLRGWAIPIESRIIAIAEAFDAMVSRDSYKRTGKVIGEELMPSASGYKSAILELTKNVGTQFDPELVEIFVNEMSEDLLEP
jgi:putative nucleotidyltransferase with HDIG domain